MMVYTTYSKYSVHKKGYHLNMLKLVSSVSLGSTFRTHRMVIMVISTILVIQCILFGIDNYYETSCLETQTFLTKGPTIRYTSN